MGTFIIPMFHKNTDAEWLNFLLKFTQLKDGETRIPTQADKVHTHS